MAPINPVVRLKIEIFFSNVLGNEKNMAQDNIIKTIYSNEFTIIG